MAGWNEWVPGTNMTLTEVLEAFKSARVGLDVKDKLYWSFYKIVELAIKEGNANFDVAKATGAFKDLASRLDAGEAKVEDNTVQLARSVKRDETGVFDLNIFDEPTRNVLQGQEIGTINAVLGVKNVKTENIDDQAVTDEKIASGVLPEIKYAGGNLYRRDQVTDGKLVGTGQFQTAANWSIAKIPLEGAGKYSIWRKNLLVTDRLNHGGYLFETSGGELVTTTINYEASTDSFDGQRWSTIEVPDGVKFIYINVRGIVPSSEPQPDDRDSTYFVKGEIVSEAVLTSTVKSINGATIALPEIKYVGGNLYRRNQVTDGKLVGTGEFQTDENWSIAKIPLEGAGKYSIWRKNLLVTDRLNHGGYLFETSAGELITPTIKYEASTDSFESQRWSTIEAPSGVEFIYINVRGIVPSSEPQPDDRDSTYFVKGDVVNEKTLTSTVKSINGATIALPEIGLKYTGKKWFILGDSLGDSGVKTTRHYFDYVRDEMGVAVVNESSSGSGYKNRETEEDSFYHNALKLPVDADFVTIFGSFNDSRDTASLGTKDDIYVDGEDNTIGACINKTLDVLYNINPMIKIGIVSPTPWWQPVAYYTSELGNPDHKHSKYVQLLKDISEKYSLPFLNLYHGSNLRPWDNEFRNIAYSKDTTQEGVHPNEIGHEILASKFTEFIKTMILPG